MPRTERTRLAGLARNASLAGALLLAACAGVPRPDADPATTFIVVRHAEKIDSSRDPGLNATGQARAQALAGLLEGVPVVAVYATEFQRTQQTALPSAQAHHLALNRYPAGSPAIAFADQLRATHPRASVLVVGHSNTVPAIVAALCRCEAMPMRDDEYDRINTVRIDANGRAVLTVTRYGAGSPPE